MQEFIYWLNEYGVVLDLTQVIVSVATAFAAIALVIATVALIRVTKKKPFVSGYLESSAYHPNYVNFVVMNTGDAAAFDIKVNVSPAIPDIHGNTRKGETESTHNVLILPPNRSFPFRGFNIAETSIEKFDVTVSWISNPKRGRRKTLTHGMSNRSSKGGWGEKGLDRIAREFEKTTKHLREIERHLKSPQNKR